MLQEHHIFLSTTFASDQSSIEDVLAICKDHDITQVELGSNHCYEEAPGDIVGNYSFTFLVHNYYPPPEEQIVVNIASLDDAIRRQSISHIKNSIDFCRQIGAQLYTFHPGFLTDPRSANIDSSNYDFCFLDQDLHGTVYDESFALMCDALEEIVEFNKAQGVRIALETEGSVTRSGHLLMQQPKEYEELFKKFKAEDLGINLNIGHLGLAANAFGFPANCLVDLLADRVVAMELSHNDGVTDDHKPLVEGAWYWDIVADNRFSKVLKVLEFRNVSIETIIANISLCESYFQCSHTSCVRISR